MLDPNDLNNYDPNEVNEIFPGEQISTLVEC